MAKDKTQNRAQSMTLVLALLRDGARHGYDLAREVERRSNDVITFNDGTLYPVLHALEQEGLIVSNWEQPKGERKRRVYSLTDSGLRELEKQVAEWKRYARAIESVLEGGSAFAGVIPLNRC